MEFTKDLIVVCTTVDSIKEARSISRILVEENLAACIQINQVRSIFEWEDEVDESPKRRPRDNGPVTDNLRAFFGTTPVL